MAQVGGRPTDADPSPVGRADGRLLCDGSSPTGHDPPVTKRIVFLSAALLAGGCGGKITQALGSPDVGPGATTSAEAGSGTGGNVYCSEWQGPVDSCDAGPDAGRVQICYAGSVAPVCGQLPPTPSWGCCSDHQPLNSCVFYGSPCN